MEFRPAQAGSPVRNVGLNFQIDSCPLGFNSLMLFYCCYSVVAASIFYRKVPDNRNFFYPDFQICSPTCVQNMYALITNFLNHKYGNISRKFMWHNWPFFFIMVIAQEPNSDFTLYWFSSCTAYAATKH